MDHCGLADDQAVLDQLADVLPCCHKRLQAKEKEKESGRQGSAQQQNTWVNAVLLLHGACCSWFLPQENLVCDVKAANAMIANKQHDRTMHKAPTALQHQLLLLWCSETAVALLLLSEALLADQLRLKQSYTAQLID